LRPVSILAPWVGLLLDGEVKRWHAFGDGGKDAKKSTQMTL